MGDAFAARQELFCRLAQIGLIALKLYQLSVTFADQGEIGRYVTSLGVVAPRLASQATRAPPSL